MELLLAMFYAAAIAGSQGVGAFIARRFLGCAYAQPGQQMLAAFVALSVAAFCGHLKG